MRRIALGLVLVVLVVSGCGGGGGVTGPGLVGAPPSLSGQDGARQTADEIDQPADPAIVYGSIFDEDDFPPPPPEFD